MWEVPKLETGGYVNNQREKYQFGFNGVIGPEAKQDEVFERVASRSVLGALEGFNGTVFAYGQTGSGKTFTISGGHDRYVDRGIIPRAISRLYSEISKRHDATYSVQITYVEIYNDQGYDLLDPDHETTALEDLPKVQLLEDDEGNVTMRNVSTHRADNEEEALNLLFLGDTNKAITETPMNQASSRSHCIFTMQVERRQQGSDTVRRAKVNLVDLAGSERVHKMGLDGQTLMEAKHINLSLHALEQVVVALQEKAQGTGRSHIPYRNSTMTMMLKDSLGGNCRTVMIATASPRGDHLLEGISTCRFAQRIAMVTNEAVVNEEVDPALIIKRLRIENRELRDELRILRGDNDDGREELTESEMERLRAQVADYCKPPAANEEPTLELGASMLKIKAALRIFREIVLQGGGVVVGKGAAAGEAGEDGAWHPEELRSEIKRLSLVVKQRDDEIDVLVSMLRKGESGEKGAIKATELLRESRSRGLDDGDGDRDDGPAGGRDRAKAPVSSRGLRAPAAENDAFARVFANEPRASREPDVPFPASPGGIAALVADRTRAFDHFRALNDRHAAVEENKVVLKNKFDDAKALGECVTRSKGEINRLKGLIEEMRQTRAATRGGARDKRDADDDEKRLVVAIDAERAAHRRAFDELRDAKREIDSLQKMTTQAGARLANDFERWFELLAERHRELGGDDSPPASPIGKAIEPESAADLSPAPTMSPLRDATNSPKGRNVSAPSQTGAPTTGNARADADIKAFYEARERLLRMRRESELLA